ncbi:hypothetical protein BGZ72_009820 [Mortierella alpina]|nr:hypothetical protein BGZ72_009820 [Mortierella alpina]
MTVNIHDAVPSAQHTMLLPEILLNVAQLLPKRDLVACLQVCSHWRLLLEPVLWHDMNFDEQAFHSYFVSADRQTRLLPSAASVEHHPHPVSRESVYAVPVPLDLVDDMFSTIADCLQLRHLALTRTTVTEDQLTPFYATLRRLKTLSLAGTCVRGFPVQDPLSLPALVSLSLLSVNMNPMNQFELIASCPNLTTLGWKSPSGPISMGSYAQIVAVKSPGIQNLDISGCECSDALMAQVIKGSPHLSRLDATKSSFGTGCVLSVLSCLGTQLRELDLRLCWNVAPEMISEIMAGCLGLNTFHAGDVPAQVLVERPFGCLKLEILTLSITEVGKHKKIQERVYEQLARLRRLRILTLCRAELPIGRAAIESEIYNQPESDSVDLRLKYGLARLAALVRLQELRSEGLVHKADVKEILWMGAAWKTLKVMRGTLHKNKKKRQQLTRLSFEAISQNAHLVQHLRVGRMDRTDLYPMDNCRSLKSLYVEDERLLSDWDNYLGLSGQVPHGQEIEAHESTEGKLSTDHGVVSRKDRWILLLIMLIRQNSSLRKLCLTMDRFEPTIGFWEAITTDPSSVHTNAHKSALSTAPTIRHLECLFTKIPRSNIQACLDAFTHLETLVLQHCTFDPDFPLELLDSNRRYPRLRSLTLATNTGLDLSTQIELIRLFPETEHLVWSIMGSQHLPVSEFCTLLAQDCCKIESLILSDRNLEASHLARILDSIPRLTRFFLRFDTLSSMFNDPDVMQAMRRHFTVLTDVEFGQVRSSIRCGTVLELLTGCPNLQRLVAYARLDCSRQAFYRAGTSVVTPAAVGTPESTSSSAMAGLDDLFNDTPWVCLGLKRLHVIMTGDPRSVWQNRTLQQRLFLQLGRLKELQTLSLGHCVLWMYENGFSHHGLDFTVEAGLSKLAGLEKLEQLNIEGIYQHMEESDVYWMLEHWPKLRVVEGELHHRKEKRERLDAMMEQRGFKVLNHSYRRM